MLSASLAISLNDNKKQQRGGDGTSSEENARGGDLSIEAIEYELLLCANPVNGFKHFCNNYGYVTEPRPPEPPGGKISFAEYLKNLKATEPLTPEDLELLPKEVQKLQATGGVLHFELWQYQEDMAHWLDWLLNTGQSGLVEKARDMGASWVMVYFLVWCWRFRPDFSALLGSRKAEDVDNRLPNSLFGKIDFAIEKLPNWLKPKGYDRATHRRNMYVVNPENGSYLRGETSNENFGRSGRYTMVFKDEEAFCQYDTSGSVSHLTKTAVYCSSANGQNHFYEIKLLFEAKSPELVLKLEWNLNPYHDATWFAEQKSKVAAHIFASEVLIDYKASVQGLYYPFCTIVESKAQANMVWQSGWPSDIAWDYGVSDATALIWWQREPIPDRSRARHHMMYAYANHNRPIEFYLPIVKATPPQVFISQLEALPTTERARVEKYIASLKQLLANGFYTENDYEFIKRLRAAGVGARLEHRGDPAGENRNQDTATSIVTALALFGVYVKSNSKANSYVSRRTALSDVLMRTVVNRDGAWPAFEAIRQSRYPTRSDNSQSTTVTDAPVHDWTSHFRSAAEYHAVNEAPPEQGKKPRSGSIFIAGGGSL